MSSLTLFTSGSTKEPKEVTHLWSTVEKCILRSIQEIGLTRYDTVLDVFPGNVIAHYTVTAFPAKYSGARLITSNFDPYNYIKLFQKYQPTYIALIPRHYDILSKTKGWNELDMSCVRYMVMGSSNISQSTIDTFRSKGVQTVANWYGMTEMPPPVFVGYNSESFDFTPRQGYTVEFTDEGECIVNGVLTGDLFDLKTKKFVSRKVQSNGKTWKTV
jgi:acyl-coenzyme A synthetase/AMP-(fatty) acid ligase